MTKKPKPKKSIKWLWNKMEVAKEPKKPPIHKGR